MNVNKCISLHTFDSICSTHRQIKWKCRYCGKKTPTVISIGSSLDKDTCDACMDKSTSEVYPLIQCLVKFQIGHYDRGYHHDHYVTELHDCPTVINLYRHIDDDKVSTSMWKLFKLRKSIPQGLHAKVISVTVQSRCMSDSD